MILYIFLAIFALLIGAVSYFLNAYSLMCLGRKAGLKADWMPYVPVVRTLYRLQIVRRPWWKIFFVGGTSVACATLLTIIWALILGADMASIAYEYSYFDSALAFLARLEKKVDSGSYPALPLPVCDCYHGIHLRSRIQNLQGIRL